jgi:3-dehydrosphinganine reductase
MSIQSAAKNPDKQRFLVISADVTKAEENTRIISETTKWNNGNPPDVVWANAGSAHPSLFLDTPMEILHSQMDIDYWAACYLARATMQSWLKPTSSKVDEATALARPPRHFIITSSVICFVGLAGYAPYGPAKSALRNLADCLRSEVQLYNGYRSANPDKGPETDVEVHICTPGTIFSPGLEQENKTKPPVTKILEESDPRQTEDEVAAAAVKGLEKGHYLISTQWLGGLMRAAMIGGSPKNNALVDTVMSWVSSIVWLFVQPDLEKKVFKWGVENEVKLPQ